MRHTILPALLILAVLVPLRHNVSASEPAVLYVYTWEGYFSPVAISDFEKKYGCRVEFDHYDSNEIMFEKMRAGNAGYDIITPSSPVAASLNHGGYLLGLDHSLLSNLKNIDVDTIASVQDRENTYSVPYTVAITGIGYDKTQVPADALGSWNILADERLTGRVTMINDMREALGAALRHLGYSVNSVDPSEIDAATRVLRGWKKNLAMFSVDQAKIGLRDGQYAAIQAYNGDVALVMEENPDIEFFVPREGAPLNSDLLVIGADTAAPRLAHAFINHFLDPDVAAINMKHIRYTMPNIPAREKMDAEWQNNSAFNIPPETLSASEVILNIGSHRSLYDKAWEETLIGE